MPVAGSHDHPLGAHGAHHALSAAAANERRLLLVLTLTAVYMLAEAVGGFLTSSLALVADAAHMLMDVLGLGMGLFAIRFAQRPATPRKTYGFYRAEILAAMINSVALFLIAGYILFEAWQRFHEPPEIRGVPMLVIAIGGLIVNLIGVKALHGHADESLNVRAAFMEVLSDLLGSAGVVAAALIITFTGWWPADPIMSAAIGIFVIPRAWQLLRSALDVLLEATPEHLDPDEIERAMAEVPGVEAVHDLHCWSITSGFVAMSAHVVARERRGADILHDLRILLRERFYIEHATIQVELTDHAEDGACCVMDPRCLVINEPSLPWGKAARATTAPAASAERGHHH